MVHVAMQTLVLHMAYLRAILSTITTLPQFEIGKIWEEYQ